MSARKLFHGSLPCGRPSETDWERVRRSIAMDEPIPYDPNDYAAVEAYWSQATIWRGWPNPVLIQKDGVPVHPDGAPRIAFPADDGAKSDASETRAKAS
jgi:hypothetical protein